MFGRGFRPTHQVELATLAEVQADLKLSDEQKTSIEELNDELGEERRALRGDGGGGGGGGFGRGFSAEAMAAQAELNAEFAGKLAEILDDDQDARILGIFAQVNGTGALNDAAVAAKLELSDEQKERLQDVAAEQRQEFMDAFQDFRDMSDEERQETMEDLNKARDEALLGVLSDEQKTKFEDLKGEKLEVDLSPLQRFGRGGRGGGGFGGGRRGGDNDQNGAGGGAGGRPEADE
jgi:hypothetical protein